MPTLEELEKEKKEIKGKNNRQAQSIHVMYAYYFNPKEKSMENKFIQISRFIYTGIQMGNQKRNKNNIDIRENAIGPSETFSIFLSSERMNILFFVGLLSDNKILEIRLDLERSNEVLANGKTKVISIDLVHFSP